MSVPFAVITALSYLPSSLPSCEASTTTASAPTTPPSPSTPPKASHSRGVSISLPSVGSPPLSPSRLDAEEFLRDLSQAQQLMGLLDDRIDALSAETERSASKNRPGLKDRKSSIDTQNILSQSRKLLQEAAKEKMDVEERLALAEVPVQASASPRRRARHPRSQQPGA